MGAIFQGSTEPRSFVGLPQRDSLNDLEGFLAVLFIGTIILSKSQSTLSGDYANIIRLHLVGGKTNALMFLKIHQEAKVAVESWFFWASTPFPKESIACAL